MNQFQELNDLVHLTRTIVTACSAWPVSALIQYIAIYIWFEFEEKKQMQILDFQLRNVR